MQNAALRTVTGCTQDTNIQHLHDETLILPIYEHLQLHASQYKQNTQTSNSSLIQTYNILQHTKALTTDATQQTFPQTPTQSVQQTIKTNNRHIHTSIVSRHLVTRGNNKILRTPPPHIISSEEIIPRITRRTLAQLRTTNSPFLKSYLQKSKPNHIHHHYVPSITVTHDTHHLFNCIHIRTTLSPLDLWTDPAGVTALLARWTEKLAGGPQVEDRTPPTSKGHGSG